MASFSNGQNEHSHSADSDSSSSHSDSEEQRSKANVNLSQRQHSAPSSASSSDSEQEEVSTRPAAEKPAAPPLPNKNRNSSDRSAVRNQSSPSDPNPNTRSASNLNIPPSASKTTSASSSDSEQEQEQVSTRPAAEKPLAPSSPKKNRKSSDKSAVRNQSTPSDPNPNDRSASNSNPNIPSGSKAKRSVAAKRARDDDFAEEQPTPKKKTASNGKHVAQEEVPDSKTSKKKLRKQLLESLAPVPRVTRSAKHMQEKSSLKKTARMWTENEENTVMHCYLNCAMEGVLFSQVFGKIKDSLDHEASKTQVSEKVRSMKKRYRSLKNKMAQGGIKEDAFAYKSPHEKELYKLWKQAWGEQHEEDEEEVESDGGSDSGKEPKVTSTEKAKVSNHKSPVSSRPIPNNKSEDRVHYETVIKETRNILAEVIGKVKKMAETFEAKLKESLISQFRPN